MHNMRIHVIYLQYAFLFTPSQPHTRTYASMFAWMSNTKSPVKCQLSMSTGNICLMMVTAFMKMVTLETD